MTQPSDHAESLALSLRGLRLPGFSAHWSDVAIEAEKGAWSFGQYLHRLCELENEGRKHRKIERHLKQSRLPLEKTLATLELARLPPKVKRQLPTLCDGGFADRGENLLAFGLPGRGKTHLVCAVGHELVRRGRRVLFSPTSMFVQRLLQAKRDLLLERELRRLDRFDAVILDSCAVPGNVEPAGPRQMNTD